MRIYDSLINRLHFGQNPYEGFPTNGWAGVWYGDPGATRPIFERAIKMCAPGLVIEVGSFVGESTIFMADILKRLGLDAAILCVDTWYGGFDHWQKVPEKLRFHFGRSSLFYQFMGNVIQHGVNDVIVPLALDSLNAARLLKSLGITARLIYVDGSHEEGDVLRDFEAYWELVEPGGGMLVDDLTGWFPGVLRDFDKFKAQVGDPVEIEGEKALFIKK